MKSTACWISAVRRRSKRADADCATPAAYTDSRPICFWTKTAGLSKHGKHKKAGRYHKIFGKRHGVDHAASRFTRRNTARVLLVFCQLLFLLQYFIDLFCVFLDDGINDRPDRQIANNKNGGKNQNRHSSPFQPAVEQVSAQIADI